VVALSAQEVLEAASAAITPQKALLDSLREINLRFLLALLDAVNAPDYGHRPTLGTIAPLFESLSWDSAARASQFPFLLMDLGLSEASARSNVHALLQQHSQVREQELPASPARHSHLALARAALVLAWHTARTDVGATLILFGLAPANAADMSSLALHELDTLAPHCVTPLCPRWAQSPLLWQHLLAPEGYKSVDTVRGFVMHAFQLTARSHLK
jgi:hypothetical protein